MTVGKINFKDLDPLLALFRGTSPFGLISKERSRDFKHLCFTSHHRFFITLEIFYNAILWADRVTP